MKTNTTHKMTSAVAIFDECVAEMSPESQEDYMGLVKYVCDVILCQPTAEDSAKEYIVKAKRTEWKFDNGYRWNGFRWVHKSDIIKRS